MSSESQLPPKPASQPHAQAATPRTTPATTPASVQVTEADVYGRGNDDVFGDGASAATTRAAKIALMNIRDVRSGISITDAIECDLYGRGDPRVFGAGAHIKSKKEAASSLRRAKRMAQVSLRTLMIPANSPSLFAGKHQLSIRHRMGYKATAEKMFGYVVPDSYSRRVPRKVDAPTVIVVGSDRSVVPGTQIIGHTDEDDKNRQFHGIQAKTAVAPMLVGAGILTAAAVAVIHSSSESSEADGYEDASASSSDEVAASSEVENESYESSETKLQVRKIATHVETTNPAHPETSEDDRSTTSASTLQQDSASTPPQEDEADVNAPVQTSQIVTKSNGAHLATSPLTPISGETFAEDGERVEVGNVINARYVAPLRVAAAAAVSSAKNSDSDSDVQDGGGEFEADNSDHVNSSADTDESEGELDKRELSTSAGETAMIGARVAASISSSSHSETDRTSAEAGSGSESGAAGPIHARSLLATNTSRTVASAAVSTGDNGVESSENAMESSTEDEMEDSDETAVSSDETAENSSAVDREDSGTSPSAEGDESEVNDGVGTEVEEHYTSSEELGSAREEERTTSEYSDQSNSSSEVLTDSDAVATSSVGSGSAYLAESA
jgi:hypothetical protein